MRFFFAFFVLLFCVGCDVPATTAFVPRLASTNTHAGPLCLTNDAASKGFGVSQTVEKGKSEIDATTLTLMEVKEKLLDLVPRMTGQDHEFRSVEELVNALEDRYQPVQTLQFLNLANQGDWQLLFSTNLSGTPNPAKFRLRELIQRIQTNKLEGGLVNEATWDLAEAGDANFDATGTFTIKCKYQINQGARMVVDLEDHILEPDRGSRIPKDVPALVGLLHRSMPKELFDPSDHAIDTTYLDVDLRIVRYTGPRLEGVRDIFIRRGALQVNPKAEESN